MHESINFDCFTGFILFSRLAGARRKRPEGGTSDVRGRLSVCKRSERWGALLARSEARRLQLWT